MSRKKAPETPERTAANDAFDQVLDVNEGILKEIQEVYSKAAPSNMDLSVVEEPTLRPALLRPREEGLMAICHKLGISCIAPRRKINVMIVGNHSAGKSSYINWYIGEHVQSTAVAIETQGFTFCTSGKKRDTLRGQATMQLFPHLKLELEKFAPSIYNGLQTEVSTSKERAFPLITFIDTPGLVDGSFQYLFPVEDAILAVAKHVDLIYIFFDPIGQALCDRTMRVIERLNLEHAEKLRYFLSKADTVPNERDRQKVVVQITQNLSSRVRNVHAFDLPSLYIPAHAGSTCKIDNILEATCGEMQHTINQNVQSNLNKLERDCRLVSIAIDKMLVEDARARTINRRATTRGLLAFALSLLGPLMLLAFFAHRSGLAAAVPAHLAIPEEVLQIWGQTCDALVAPEAGSASGRGAQSGVSSSSGDGGGSDGSADAPGAAAPSPNSAPSPEGMLTLFQLLLGTLCYFVSLQLLSQLLWRRVPSRTNREVQNLHATQKYVQDEILKTKERLYRRYIDQVSSEVQ